MEAEDLRELGDPKTSESAGTERDGVVGVVGKGFDESDDRFGEVADHEDLVEGFEAEFQDLRREGADRHASFDLFDPQHQAFDGLLFAAAKDARNDLHQAALGVVEGLAAFGRGGGVDHAEASEFLESLGDEASGEAEEGSDLALGEGFDAVEEGGPEAAEVGFEAEAFEEVGEDRKDLREEGIVAEGVGAIRLRGGGRLGTAGRRCLWRDGVGER